MPQNHRACQDCKNIYDCSSSDYGAEVERSNIKIGNSLTNIVAVPLMEVKNR